jgi:hypothetical protein
MERLSTNKRAIEAQDSRKLSYDEFEAKLKNCRRTRRILVKNPSPNQTTLNWAKHLKSG